MFCIKYSINFKELIIMKIFHQSIYVDSCKYILYVCTHTDTHGQVKYSDDSLFHVFCYVCMKETSSRKMMVP